VEGAAWIKRLTDSCVRAYMCTFALGHMCLHAFVPVSLCLCCLPVFCSSVYLSMGLGGHMHMGLFASWASIASCVPASMSVLCLGLDMRANVCNDMCTFKHTSMHVYVFVQMRVLTKQVLQAPLLHSNLTPPPYLRQAGWHETQCPPELGPIESNSCKILAKAPTEQERLCHVVKAMRP
jgi:hypothetical protein